ncbi:asialoglycoprotein receptor 2-like isoform X2 [Cheilinus undulatus]|uniref:asialoglycoprotein receptor 2-like isoform X2 n=1 Tax=Cheilinus undulatus TaxID=241271 RepID=UPI001BD37086|nr:asialoglycoprotein receptor 2-like isoform X2 [Cheilinus undulatus]
MDLMEIDESVHMKRSLTKDGLVTKDYMAINPLSEDLIRTAYSTRGHLEATLSSVTDEKEPLQKSCNTLKQERDQLATNYSSLETVRDDLTRERDQLQQSYNSLNQERDQLQTNYTSIQNNLNNLQRENNDLQTQFNTMRTNRDELQRSNAALMSEKDQLQRSKNSLQSQFNTLQREKDQLRTDYNSLTHVRDQLQQKVNKTDKPCPVGWRKFGCNKCFYVSTQARSWSSSRDFCIYQGGHLAILNNRDKMMFVNGLLRPRVNAWIGLTDIASEGTWKWVDGTNATTTFWKPGQPDSYGGDQDCVQIVQGGEAGDWNDKGCHFPNVCVCEKAL